MQCTDVLNALRLKLYVINVLIVRMRSWLSAVGRGALTQQISGRRHLVEGTWSDEEGEEGVGEGRGEEEMDMEIRRPGRQYRDQVKDFNSCSPFVSVLICEFFCLSSCK